MRISPAVHEVLKEEARASGRSMQAVLEEAIELYRRRRFLAEVNAAYARVREDEKAWGEELDERRDWEQASADGFDDV